MKDPFSFLPASDSEMAVLVRAYDWKTTSLGDPAQWSQSLRTTLSIVLNSKFPMFLFWGRDCLCFYNDAFRPSLGNEGKHPFALAQPGEKIWAEIWNDIKPVIDDVFAGNASQVFTDQLLPMFRNGKIEDVYWTYCYSKFEIENGEIGGVIVACNETTHQLYTENKLKQYDQRFENLLKDAPVGMVVLIGDELRVDMVNEMYGRLINLTPDEMTGRRLFDMIPEAETYFRPLIEKVVSSGAPMYLYGQPYLVHVKGEKQQGFLNVVYQPYKSVKGEILGVMALCHDVTEQVAIRKQVEEAESKARLAIDSAGLGVYEIDYETDVMRTSDRFNEIWGVTRNVPRNEFAGYIHADDTPGRMAAHAESLKTGNLKYEARLCHKDGSVHWVKVSGKIIYTEEGIPKTLLGVIQDITEQKQFADKLTSLVAERTVELERSNEDLLQFAHVASHDLKEPLRKIKMYTGRLDNELRSSGLPNVDSFMQKIKHASERMSSMIDGVLKYSTVSSAQQPTERVNLNKVVGDIEADLEVMIHQKSAVIKKEKLPEIEGAPVLLYQLFYNLLYNSLKFSKEGRAPLIRIDTSGECTNDTDYCRIVVSDNGIGFDNQHAERIFDTFSRLNTKDEYEGTGLGLSLCKKIVERHHGAIHASGETGKGAVFTIRIPLHQSDHTV